MTDFETIARQKLFLVSDNPFPSRTRNTYERIGYLAGLIAGVCFVYAVGWPLLCLLFSFG